VPRSLEAEINAIVEDVGSKIKVFVAAESPLKTAADTMAVEQALAGFGRELSDRVMELSLQTSLKRREPIPRSAGRAPGWKTVPAGRRNTHVRLLGGRTVTVLTSYRKQKHSRRRGPRRGTGRRGPSGTGWYPALTQLGIVAGATPATVSEVARQVADSHSFEVAQQVLISRGLDLNIKTMARLTYRFAECSLAQRAVISAKPPAPPSGPLASKRVVVSVDGGRTRIRRTPRHGRRRQSGHRGFSAPWREPKVLTIYTIDQDGQRERRQVPLHDGTMADADAVFALIVGHLRVLGAQYAAQLTLIGDGARWIWNRIDELVAAVGIAKERFVAIVDFYHAVEHLQKVADLRVGWSQKQRKRWVRWAKKRLRAGRIDDVIAAIDELCLGRKAKALSTEREYFVHNKERMRYKKFRLAFLPIGSGAVESAVRRLVNQRLKSNGTYWLEQHAEAVLHLRAHLKAGRWNQLALDVFNKPFAQVA
jgi:hypothetical protein